MPQSVATIFLCGIYFTFSNLEKVFLLVWCSQTHSKCLCAYVESCFHMAYIQSKCRHKFTCKHTKKIEPCTCACTCANATAVVLASLVKTSKLWSVSSNLLPLPFFTFRWLYQRRNINAPFMMNKMALIILLSNLNLPKLLKYPGGCQVISKHSEKTLMYLHYHVKASHL